MDATRFETTAAFKELLGEYVLRMRGDCQIFAPPRRHHRHILQRKAALACAPFLSLMSTGEIHQDAAHQLCGDCKEVRTILPPHWFPVDESHVGFVDECCRLQRLTGLFAGHLFGSQLAQLIVNERQELLGSLRVAMLDGR